MNLWQNSFGIMGERTYNKMAYYMFYIIIYIWAIEKEQV